MQPLRNVAVQYRNVFQTTVPDIKGLYLDLPSTEIDLSLGPGCFSLGSIIGKT